KSTRYADHDGTVPDGRFSTYNSSGDLDSTGLFNNGKKNGEFLTFKKSGQDSIVPVRQYIYAEDSLLKSLNIPSELLNNDRSDSLNKKAEYPGGNIMWEQYVSKSLRYPERANAKR